ncbi:peptidyl-alpha-hydroxyglycine alpha-amidating lyase 2 [Diachasma alloeum]|uniref:peptidyl-alpha-hydroxyglycine alpha-amidating lyase 2 n=1 Tax=Diachasma alloeum TaxID=454923 RepID=UPI0007383779|nr:peptidyl-alpha-hydroxyglycine alpha-amidating lyase 2 [Diachasma alloeum]
MNGRLDIILPIVLGIIGIATGRFVDVDDGTFQDIVDELLNLLNEKGERSETVEQQKVLYPVEQAGWQGPAGVGQIVGVSVHPSGKPVIFHRADRIWDYNSFDDNLEYREAFRGPIQQDTVLNLNPLNGVVESAWGADMFYLPHGLHIDANGNTWLTDVALHQVFKFTPGSIEPEIALGERFIRGSDNQHFCQPTSVAISRTGEIVVADGYCNNRIMVFDPSGNLINKMPQPGEFVALRVPHALAILEQGDVCVADRENMRVICLNIGLRMGSNNDEKRGPPLTLHQPDLGRVFAIAAHGNTLYAVNGPTSPMIPVRGFIMDPNSETIFGHWAPATQTFMQPHAMAISPNGTELYVTEIGPNRMWKFHLVSDPSRQIDPQTLMKI